VIPLDPHQAGGLHLAAALPNLMLAVDNQQPNLTGNVVDEPHRIDRGSLRAPNGAGLGVQLNQ
jgi:L-alanine-DL-glutamate epimerase-like enolase superfamily enzyme